MAIEDRSIEQWRSVIHQALSNHDSLDRLSSTLAKFNSLHGRKDDVNFREEALEFLRAEGIVDLIVDSVLLPNTSTVSIGAENFRQQDEHYLHELITNPNSVNLVIELITGRAFIGHLNSYEDCLRDEDGTVKSNASIILSFNRQRFRSKAVPFISDMVFRDMFVAPIDDATPHGLFLQKPTSRQLVHIVMVSQNLETDKRLLIASTTLDWRKHLFRRNSNSTGGKQDPWTSTISLELKSTDPDSKLTVGILDLRLRLIWPQSSTGPSNSSKNRHVTIPPEQPPPSVVEAHFELEAMKSRQREQAFTLYARQWWKEFAELRAGQFANRTIKVFALDENSTTQFVCNFVHPLSGDRLLETPAMAARFVSTIPCEPCRGVGGGCREQWCSALAFVTRNRGDVMDHVNLLCSLLLGFGFDAFVALGTRRHTDRNSSTRGQYGDLNGVDNSLYGWVLVFQDRTHWSPMSAEVIATITPYSTLRLHHLSPPPPNHTVLTTLSNQLETELRQLITEWRAIQTDQLAFAAKRSVSTDWQWDPKLAELLIPILAGFEEEQLYRLNQVDERSMETSLHMDPLHCYVPEGCTFKAYPIQLLHTNAKRILATSLRSPLCREILAFSHGPVRCGLCVRVYAYAELATVTWVMFACITSQDNRLSHLPNPRLCTHYTER